MQNAAIAHFQGLKENDRDPFLAQRQPAVAELCEVGNPRNRSCLPWNT
jgi:hypothetical protein